MTVSFTVPGPPVGKGRPRFSEQSGRVRTYTPEETARYERAVRAAYRQSCGDAFFARGTPVIAGIIAFFPIPKREKKAERERMRTSLVYAPKKPDCDNIAKAILDALNGIAYADDAQIAALHVSKFYDDEPRVFVKLYEAQQSDIRHDEEANP